MQLDRFIHVLRFLTFFVGLIAFFCHLSQCLLLKKYKEKTGIPDWLTAGHWQYMTWYISLVLSLAGSLAVGLNATYLRRSTTYSVDKCVGSLVVIPVLVSIITTFAIDPAEPWTNNRFKFERSSSALLTYCNALDASGDEFYMLLYQRCMLSECTWIFAILVCIIWMSLVGFVTVASRKKKTSIAKSVIRPVAVEEPKWGRYIPDPPTSIYSATTLNNRSGLLTPTSTLTREKHNEFYYNCNIPKIFKSATSDCSYYNVDYATTLAYDHFTRRDYDREYPSPSYYHDGGSQEEEDHKSNSSTSSCNSRQLLSMSTSNCGSSLPPLSEKKPESVTTITTPLYSKFSSSNKNFNDMFRFVPNSSNSYYSSLQ